MDTRDVDGSWYLYRIDGGWIAGSGCCCELPGSKLCSDSSSTRGTCVCGSCGGDNGRWHSGHIVPAGRVGYIACRCTRTTVGAVWNSSWMRSVWMVVANMLRVDVVGIDERLLLRGRTWWQTCGRRMGGRREGFCRLRLNRSCWFGNGKWSCLNEALHLVVEGRRGSWLSSDLLGSDDDLFDIDDGFSIRYARI